MSKVIRIKRKKGRGKMSPYGKVYSTSTRDESGTTQVIMTNKRRERDNNRVFRIGQASDLDL